VQENPFAMPQYCHPIIFQLAFVLLASLKSAEALYLQRIHADEAQQQKNLKQKRHKEQLQQHKQQRVEQFILRLRETEEAEADDLEPGAEAEAEAEAAAEGPEAEAEAYAEAQHKQKQQQHKQIKLKSESKETSDCDLGSPCGTADSVTISQQSDNAPWVPWAARALNWFYHGAWRRHLRARHLRDVAPNESGSHQKVLLYWAAKYSSKIMDLIMKNVNHLRSSGLDCDVLIAHYDLQQALWRKRNATWYDKNVLWGFDKSGWKVHLLKDFAEQQPLQKKGYSWVWMIDEDMDLTQVNATQLFRDADDSQALIVGPSFVQLVADRDDETESPHIPMNRPQDSTCKFRYAPRRGQGGKLRSLNRREAYGSSDGRDD